MVTWYLPAHTRQLARRWFSFRSMLLGLMVIAFLITEFRFNWMESLIGSYLVASNAVRPQSGAVWDQGQQSRMARETLASYMDQRQNAQREVRQAESLGQVVESLTNGADAMISAAHFVELYLKLPPVLANEIVSPFTLLSQLSSGKWQRVYFDRRSDQLHVLMLDGENQVLNRLGIGASLLTHIQRGEVAINSRLEQLSDLSANIYPAERFFSVLNTFPADVRQAVIAHPEDLLRVSGRLARVGISRNQFYENVDIGFEIESTQGPKVILMQGRREAVHQIQRALAGGGGFFQWPRSREALP